MKPEGNGSVPEASGAAASAVKGKAVVKRQVPEDQAASLNAKVLQWPLPLPRELPLLLFCTLVLLAGSALLSHHALQPALERRWTGTSRRSLTHADEWVLELTNGKPGYFVDVGAFGAKGDSNTKLLEERGWRGLCVDPVARGFQHRECGFVPRPIGARSGERTNLASCAIRPAEDGQATCREDQVTTLSMGQVLDMVEAPAVIDYISVGARNLGPDVLDGFPWDRYCARAWTIEHSDEDKVKLRLRRVLGSRHCQMAQGVADTWASCQCGDAASAAAQGRLSERPELPASLPRAARRLPSMG